MFRQALILVDVNEREHEALSFRDLSEWIREFEGRTHLLHLIKPFAVEDWGSRRFESAEAKSIRAAREALISLANDTGLLTANQVSISVRIGDEPAAVKEAIEIGADLIYIYSPSRRFFAWGGRTGYDVGYFVRHAPCPILVKPSRSELVR